LLGVGWNFCWVEAHVSHIDGSRVEGHFLVLLGVVQRKVESRRWNFCWVESHVSHIVGSRLEAHDSHIVWSRARTVVNCRRENQFSRNITRFFLYCWIVYCWEPVPYCWEPVGRTLSQIVGSRWECLVFLLLGAGGEVYFLILLGVVRRRTNPHIECARARLHENMGATNVLEIALCNLAEMLFNMHAAA
jgi:hypothetical protein